MSILIMAKRHHAPSMLLMIDRITPCMSMHIQLVMLLSLLCDVVKSYSEYNGKVLPCIMRGRQIAGVPAKICSVAVRPCFHW
jgi:hypothetical protein